MDASIPFYRDRAVWINFLSFRLKSNMGIRKMAAVKSVLINVKSRTAGISDINLNPRHKTVIKIAIVIANQLLAIALFECNFASLLTIIKDNPKADEGYHDREDRKPVGKWHIGVPEHKDYINIMEPNYGS